METIRVLILAVDPLVRGTLARLVNAADHLHTVAQVRDSDEIVELANDFDVILWDLGWELPEILPDMREFEVPVIALVSDADDTAATLGAGALGVLRRDAHSDDIEAAARGVRRGLLILDASLAESGLLYRPVPDESAAVVLTPREQEVINLLAEGLTNRAIAYRLNISEHTVKFHVNAIMSKLRAQSRTEAVVRATRSGILSL